MSENQHLEILNDYYQNIHLFYEPSSKRIVDKIKSMSKKVHLEDSEIAQLKIDLNNFDRELIKVFKSILKLIFEETNFKDRLDDETSKTSEKLIDSVQNFRDDFDDFLTFIEDKCCQNNANFLLIDFFFFWTGVIQVIDFLEGEYQIISEIYDDSEDETVIDKKNKINIEKEFYQEWFEFADERLLFNFSKLFVEKFLKHIVPIDLFDIFMKAILIAINKELISIDSKSRDKAYQLKKHLLETFEIQANSTNQFYYGFKQEKVDFLQKIAKIYDTIVKHGDDDLSKPILKKDAFLYLFNQLRLKRIIHSHPYNPFYNNTDFGYILHLLSGYSQKKLRAYDDSQLELEYAKEVIPVLESLVKDLKAKVK